MKLTQNDKDFIYGADSKALGTYNETINVVPVSSIFFYEENIILCDYFMKKTRENIIINPEISLSCWTGTQGLQIKASAEYQTSGDIFEDIKQKIIIMHPERTLRGIIILTPHTLFDTSI